MRGDGWEQGQECEAQECGQERQWEQQGRLQRQWWYKQKASDVDSSYVPPYAQQTLRIVWGRTRRR